MGGNSTGRRRRFGNVRKLPSGNWQVRYPGPDGLLRSDQQTYGSKSEAERRLVEADVRRGEWVDPDAGKVSVKEYAEQWIAARDLEDRTRELYLGYLRNHIGPALGGTMLCDLSPPRVRSWRNGLKESGVGATTIARCYSLLRAVLNTAVDDEILRRNPCRIRGGGQVETPERPTASLAEVFAIAASIDRRYRLMVLLAAFGQLRFGELVALRRSDLSVPPSAAGGSASLRVSRALAELNSGRQRLKGPKSTG